MDPLGRAAARFAVVAGLLVLACLLAAHDDSWTYVLAFLVAFPTFGLVLRVVANRSRWRAFLVFVACLLVVTGGTSLAKTRVDRRGGTDVDGDRRRLRHLLHRSQHV